MDAYRKTASANEYAFHFSQLGYNNLSALACQHGNRSFMSMLQLAMVTLIRDPIKQLQNVEYSAHDLAVTRNVKLTPSVYMELVRIADANSVPRECVGEMLSNYAVTV